MDVMQLRRSLLMQKFGGLPAAYRQVEYLQSNSNGEYIDTGYKGNMGIAVETRFNLLKVTRYPGVIGNRIGDNRFAFPVYYAGFDLALSSDTNVGVWELNHIYNAKIITNPVSGADSTMQITDDNGYDVTIYNNTKVNNNINLYMYRYNRNGSPDTSAATLRIYYLRLYDGGLNNNYLVRNFIPCVRKSDSEPGMYDTVTKTFFTNAGTGEFTIPT